jgi:hypothetical protein
MKDYFDDAAEELKRVDHQIYVSLKYTRTVDVLFNIIQRMIDAYELMIDGLLSFAKDKGTIHDVPSSPVKKGELLKKLYQDATIHENLDLYFLLRRITKANYDRENEYRRHVTIVTYLDGKQELINIDIITKYYHFQHDFLTYLRTLTTT